MKSSAPGARFLFALMTLTGFGSPPGIITFEHSSLEVGLTIRDGLYYVSKPIEMGVEHHVLFRRQSRFQRLQLHT